MVLKNLKCEFKLLKVLKSLRSLRLKDIFLNFFLFLLRISQTQISTDAQLDLSRGAPIFLNLGAQQSADT